MRRAVLIVWVTCLLLVVPAMTQAQSEVLPPPQAGLIAYIGNDQNVYTLNLTDYSSTQLTQDAGRTRRYEWPTWSSDGRLAYFSTHLEDSALLTDVFISADGLADGTLAYSGPEVFNYAYWSPGDCGASARCRDLAVLLSSATRGMFVELIRDSADDVTAHIAGLGGPPFYYSWSPDGSRMLWQRNNQRLDIYDASQDRVVDTLDQQPGFILSPAWSPVDDRLLFGARQDQDTTDLMIVSDGDSRTLAAGFSGLVSSSWSPDGNRVAYREQTAQGFGSLVVVDAVTAQTIARSPASGVIAFFWSPGSQQIAYLTLASPPDSFSASVGSGHLLAQAQQPVGIAWSVLNVNTGDVIQYGAFLPTAEMIYLIQYFDQFAQSHRVWSPDSRHLLYSELTPSGPAINLLDTSQVGSVPVTVAEGVVGVWSFQ